MLSSCVLLEWARGERPLPGTKTPGLLVAAVEGLAGSLAEEPPVVLREPAEVEEAPVERDVGHPLALLSLEQVVTGRIETEDLEVRLGSGVEVLAERLVKGPLARVERLAEARDRRRLGEVLAQPGLGPASEDAAPRRRLDVAGRLHAREERLDELRLEASREGRLPKAARGSARGGEPEAHPAQGGGVRPQPAQPSLETQLAEVSGQERAHRRLEGAALEADGEEPRRAYGPAIELLAGERDE